MMSDICRILAQLCPTFSDKCSNIATNIDDNMYLLERSSSYTNKISAGLMSGVKTTSLFGSLINLAICRIIHKKLGLTPAYLAVLGDDIDLGYDYLINPGKIYKEYKLI